MCPTYRRKHSGDTEEPVTTEVLKEKEMLNNAEVLRSLARERQRELMDEAERGRLAKAARERNRAPDSHRRDGR